MDELHHQARQLDERNEDRARGRQMLREAVSCRMQSYFVTLSEHCREDADALLQNAESRGQLG